MHPSTLRRGMARAARALVVCARVALALVVCALGCRAAGGGPAGDGGAPDVEPAAAAGLRVLLRPLPGPRAGVEVRIELDGPEAARVEALAMQPRFGDIAGPPLVESLQVADAEGPVPFGEERSRGRFRLGRAVAGPRLTLRYFARADPSPSPLGLHVDGAGLSGIGHGFLLLPELDARLPVRLRFDLGAFGGGAGGRAAGVEAASSFGVGSEIMTRASARELGHAVYVVGPLAVEDGGYGERLVAVAADGLPLRTVLSDSAELGRTVRRAFALGEPGPVTLLAVGAPGIGDGHDGVWLERSFAVWLDMQRGYDARVRILLAHEWSHAFVGSALRVVSDPAADGAAPSAAPWFTEGFAIHFARELALRAGLITPGDYVDDLNRSLEAVERASGDWPGRPEPGDVNHRGALYAARLGALAARDRGTLERFLLELAESAGVATEPVPWAASVRRDVARARFVAAVVARFGAEEAEIHARAVEGGERSVPLPKEAFGPCVRPTRALVAVRELGFDRASLAADGTGAARRVVPRSRAALAGLRDGDRVLEARGLDGSDPDAEVTLVVAAAGGERALRYRPRAEVTRNRYALAPVPSCRGSAVP
ncbi:MAG: hypothetical protein HY908_26935 [Myxococcales bacterium]|nr:hypothetical protein [Myxococcales bacterium]